MSAGRYALLVATGRYENEDLGRLRSPARDAQDLADVLKDPRIGGFEVATVLDGRHREVTRAIERFFLDRRRDDLLLLHISCHGLKNNNGELHFAARDTDRRLLASTSVPALFVHQQMRACRARSIVLLLDCCYSGAFLAGSKGDTTVHVEDELAGHGRAVLTATNRTEYAWEGERITALNPEPSLFTGAVVRGLRTGEADRDRDGLIGVHELYDFVYDELQAARVAQRPQVWAELERRVVVARSVLPPVPRAGGGGEPRPGPAPPAPRPAPVPVSAHTGAGAPERPWSAPAPLLLLTEALTGLPCMEDARGRQQFATVLGELLARRVDLRGVRQREDVVAIVRTALKEEGGESALLSTVELFEGAPAAAEVRHRLLRGDGFPAPGRGPGPAPVPAARAGEGPAADGRAVASATGPAQRTGGSPAVRDAGSGRMPGAGTGTSGSPAVRDAGSGRMPGAGTRPGGGPVGPDRGPASGPGTRRDEAPAVRGRTARPAPGPAAARQGAPLTVARGFRVAVGRLHGALSLLLLTDALCELPCLGTPRARTRFAAALGQVLGRPVDVRGAGLREDAVVIARAALAAPGGKRALVEVTRALGGARAGHDLGWLINAPD
ncbi:caspase, EACC1-associated type [Streptomyces marokkonensis]|uniref:caspase, EACC1-associated type n=1 Tax=Streptomyces marokkonensis TaxID=324855 RepID=UPI0011F2B528|nr:caspase family protein [Streptomyces marokkonensis]